MSFSEIKKSIISSKSSGLEWKKAVLSGIVTSPKCDLENSKEHLIFIAHKHPSLISEASIYLLMAPSQINANFPYEITAANCALSDKNTSEKVMKLCKMALNSLQCTTENVFNYIDVLKEFQSEILTDWMKHKEEIFPKAKQKLSLEELQTIFKIVQDILFSRLTLEKNMNTETHELSPYKSNDMDPSDWPERLHLLHKQIQEDKIRKCGSLANIIPSPKKTIIVSAKDIGKYFNSSGEANKPLKETVQVLSQISYSNHSEVKCQKFSPSKRIHDIYVNYDNICEEGELIRTKMKDRFVLQETASSCCNVQQAPNYTAIPLPQANKRKKSNSPSPNKVKRQKMTPSKSPKTKQRSRSNTKKSDVKLKNDSKNSQSLKHRHISVPLRRSPRKHPSQLSLSSKKKNSGRYIPMKQEDLSEKHKMKLREAVVTALQEHNIVINHIMFKPCARKLFAVCKPFVKDIVGKGSTSSRMKQIAAAHAKQVVDFEMQKKNTH